LSKEFRTPVPSAGLIFDSQSFLARRKATSKFSQVGGGRALSTLSGQLLNMMRKSLVLQGKQNFFAKRKEPIDKESVLLGRLGPQLLVTGLDGREILSHWRLEANVSEQVAVGHEKRRLPRRSRRPSAFGAPYTVS
jgi:hypothetical protein